MLFIPTFSVVWLGNAPKGQKAVSPRHRLGCWEQERNSPRRGKSSKTQCFCPYGANSLAMSQTQGVCPGLTAHWPFRPFLADSNNFYYNNICDFLQNVLLFHKKNVTLQSIL